MALAFTGIIANYIARKLALTRSKTQRLIQRLASLTNIGKTISLRYSTDELLMAIYTECRTVIDCSLFGIALHDASTNELSFELDVRDGEIAAEGAHPGRRRPELLGRSAPPAAAPRQHAEERRFGVKSRRRHEADRVVAGRADDRARPRHRRHLRGELQEERIHRGRSDPAHRDREPGRGGDRERAPLSRSGRANIALEHRVRSGRTSCARPTCASSPPTARRTSSWPTCRTSCARR